MRVDSEFDVLACLNGGTSVDTSDGVVLFARNFHIKEGFVTEFFHNVDVSVDDGLGRRRNKDFFVVDIFGTNAERDFLSDISVVDKTFSFLFRNLDLVVAESSVHFAVLAAEHGMLEEVHLRRT